MTEDEIEGRLAALEAVASLGLHGYGLEWEGSRWPTQIARHLAEAKEGLPPQLAPVVRQAAELALTRMFEASAKGFSRR